MDTLRIQGLGGRHALSGVVSPKGAKNAALKALAATVLFSDEVSLHNVPDIADVEAMIALLQAVGVSVYQKDNGRVVCHAPKESVARLEPSRAKKMRASIVLAGPLLTRYGKVVFPHPGGCVIGERPIDLFLMAFKKMGARISRSGDTHTVTAPRGGLVGTRIFFENVSVTATETLMLTAVLARGDTILSNAALEPEIAHLAEFLNTCGARIEGAGTSTIHIKGVRTLKQAKRAPYVTPPDRIETGSFIILGALCARDLTIQDCIPEHVASTVALLRRAGVDILEHKNTLRIRQKRSTHVYTAVDIKTHEYPGFPTDLQAPMVVFLTQTKGEAKVFETIFEGRLNYVESLNSMGAHITSMDPHRILVQGPTSLHGKELESPDLRAGLAYIIAALVARGTSIIHNAHYIDRGYERIDERLRAIGADIERIGN